MNIRIKKLREQSLNAINYISHERALLVTNFYRNNKNAQISTPVKRALALKHILSNKEIFINENELIIGERGPAPKATPTYPEICLHSTKDLEILDSRPKVSFKVSAETKRIYEDIIIPFWRGKTIREKIFDAMESEWINSYEAGIFTEFLEQRAPGHTVSGNKIYSKGMLNIKADIKKTLDKLKNTETSEAVKKREELMAMEIAADSIILFADRHADKLEELEQTETDKKRKQELRKIANVCRNVPANPPLTFHEALQYYWFVHIGVITELNPWDSFSPGRLDQHLYPFYKIEIENGTITKEEATELLQAFWIKFNNHPAPPKVGVTALESNTYTDFALINLGGLKEDGANAVNELSYLILDVIEEMRLLQPSSMVQLSKQNPDSFVKRAINIIKTGFGQPSVFNTDAIIQQLLSQGKSLSDARNGGCSGCVETGAFGTESYILTGYFNLVKVLEITLCNGVDPRNGKTIGLQTGSINELKSFDRLINAFKTQLQHFINIKIRGNNYIEQLFADYMPVPFLSLIIEDCVENATDYNSRGARYNTSYIQGVGLGSITDILTSIKFNVFDNRKIALNELILALDSDFDGYDELRCDLIYNSPKYGNDDDYADDIACRVFDIFHNSVAGQTSPNGATLRINMLPTTCHIYFGSVVNATADGRKASQPLSEGISPVQGSDKNGPTAVIKSASKIDHIKTGGTLLNQKFSPDFFKTDNNINKLVSLIRSYFKLDGHHIQFNVVSADTLRMAQKNPEKYSDLIVRVAGYSDYFKDLGEDLQNEIISRTEQYP